MFELHYRSFVLADDLKENECTVHRAASAEVRFWLLWWNSRRETDGALALFATPILPNASYKENGPGGRSWGCNRAGVGRWLIGPSINVLDEGDKMHLVAGHAPESRSLWHQTPIITGVPEDEPWCRGEDP